MADFQTSLVLLLEPKKREELFSKLNNETVATQLEGIQEIRDLDPLAIFVSGITSSMISGVYPHQLPHKKGEPVIYPLDGDKIRKAATETSHKLNKEFKAIEKSMPSPRLFTYRPIDNAIKELLKLLKTNNNTNIRVNAAIALSKLISSDGFVINSRLAKYAAKTLSEILQSNPNPETKLAAFYLLNCFDEKLIGKNTINANAEIIKSVEVEPKTYVKAYPGFNKLFNGKKIKVILNNINKVSAFIGSSALAAAGFGIFAISIWQSALLATILGTIGLTVAAAPVIAGLLLIVSAAFFGYSMVPSKTLIGEKLDETPKPELQKPRAKPSTKSSSSTEENPNALSQRKSLSRDSSASSFDSLSRNSSASSSDELKQQK
jgi:hypothetical protein